MYPAGSHQPLPIWPAPLPQMPVFLAPPLQCCFCQSYFPREDLPGHLETHLPCPYHCWTHKAQFPNWEKKCDHQLAQQMIKDGTGNCQIVTQPVFVRVLIQAAVEKSDSLHQPVSNFMPPGPFQASSWEPTLFFHNSGFQNGDSVQTTLPSLGEVQDETNSWNGTLNPENLSAASSSTTQIKVEVEETCEETERDRLKDDDLTPPALVIDEDALEDEGDAQFQPTKSIEIWTEDFQTNNFDMVQTICQRPKTPFMPLEQVGAWCEVCRKFFKSTRGLRRHHCPCPYCGHKFPKKQLDRHILDHSFPPETPFPSEQRPPKTDPGNIFQIMSPEVAYCRQCGEGVECEFRSVRAHAESAHSLSPLVRAIHECFPELFKKFANEINTLQLFPDS